MGDSNKAISRGRRLRQLRELTARGDGKPLTRAALARKHSINSHTLKNWEVGHGTGLTENGAKQMVNIYQKEYIDCSLRWLMEGEGPKPKQRNPTLVESPSSYSQSDPLMTLQEEVDHFKSQHPEGVIFTIKDDAMAPMYLPGDTVGGIRRYAKDLIHVIDKDCIVEIKGGKVCVRRIQNSTVPNLYNLYALNPSSKIELPTLYSVEILSAAPIIRIWRGKKW